MPRLRIRDAAGRAWQAEADRRWRAAERLAAERGGSPLDHYVAPPLPVWRASPHVRRPVFGRFVLDRATGILHDVTRARAACQVDAIREATFVHFAHELAAAAPDATACPHCLER